MIPGFGVHMLQQAHYYCPEHDVFGVGTECWMGDCTDLETTWVPGWTQSHHHDPSVKQVAIGPYKIPVRRELKRIIP